MGIFLYLFLFSYGESCFFLVVNGHHADKKSAHATSDLRSGHAINARSTGFVSGKTIDCDGVECIMCVRGLGGERLPAASYALHPNLKNCFVPSRRGRYFFPSIVYTPGAKLFLFRRLAGARHITGRRLKTVTLLALLERSPVWGTNSLLMQVICRQNGSEYGSKRARYRVGRSP